IILLSPIAYSPFLFFIGAIIVTSSLEYFTGFVLESIFKTTWWDYSDEKYNFDGKICLKFSIYWGFLSLFLFYFIHSSISQFVSLIISKTSFYLSSVLFLYFLADFIFTIISLYGFKNILEKFNQLKNQKIDQLELNHFKNEIIEKQNEIFKHFTQKYKRLIRAFPNLKSSKYYILDDIKSKIEELKTKNQFH
ncbi:MAG: putative ABC transporter permease, partial [Candidatus Shapirobacteria bacterium]|nr:putative ABC transporter permease [Candidatus Shapirobacteria bacterium]